MFRLFFWIPSLAPNEPLPRASFDGICDVLSTSSTLQKRAVFFCLRAGGRRHMAHAMRFNARDQMPCASPDSICPAPDAWQADPDPMHRSCGCNRTCDCTHIKKCFPLQKFFTSFFVHHPSRIKNPRNQKHPQFHPVINEHGNKRLRRPILFHFRVRVHEVEPIE